MSEIGITQSVQLRPTGRAGRTPGGREAQDGGSFDRALDAVSDEVRAMAPGLIEGIELTRRDLLNVFEKHRIVAIDPKVGDRFDPNLHQAMFELPTNELPAGSVAEVIQDGYVIADRLLRPALVGVAKAAPEAAAEAVRGGRVDRSV